MMRVNNKIGFTQLEKLMNNILIIKWAELTKKYFI